jgi:tRNA1Val (adenine37-N6)-methyltransferase
MMGNIFRFKKFQVDQQGCGMKINTDGVMLGAMSTISNTVLRPHCLDIGTGTGVIAMMLAQRFPEAIVDAVDIEESAAHAASTNFLASPFNDRLNLFFGDITTYQTKFKYDLIVSNPPYFLKDLKSVEMKKSVARHAGDSFFEGLISKSAELLSTHGLLWLILPLKQAELVSSMGLSYGLCVNKVVNIHSDNSKPIIRKVICLGREILESKEQSFYIYESEKVYTEQYKALLKDFFLAF